ncbi:MAG: FHA domain-containing protein [Lentisphaeria bacterium]
MRLKALTGSSEGKIISLSNTVFTIGRELDNKFIIDETGVSRHHCTLTPIGKEWFIEDCQSVNGVLVNNVPIKKATALKPGDVISIYNYKFQFLNNENQKNSPSKIETPPQSIHEDSENEGIPYGKIVFFLILLLIAVGLLFLLFIPQKEKKDIQTKIPLTEVIEKQNLPQEQKRTSTVETQIAIQEKTPLLKEENATVQPPEPTTTIKDTPINTATVPIVESFPYLIESIPAEAEVWLDNVKQEDKTPLILANLSSGKHSLKLSAPGYEDAKKQIFPSTKSLKTKVQLSLKPKTLLITSTPENAQIWHGSQFLGLTPKVIQNINLPNFEYILIGPGCVPQKLSAEILDYRGTTTHTVLQSALGDIEITTIPAHCNIYISNTLYGTTKPNPKTPYTKSLPFLIKNIRSGNVILKIEHSSGAGNTQIGKIQVPLNSLYQRTIAINIPTYQLFLTDGTVKYGMILDLADNGDVLLKEPDKHMKRYYKPQIQKIHKLSDKEIVEYYDTIKKETLKNNAVIDTIKPVLDFEERMKNTSADSFNKDFSGRKYKLSGTPILISRESNTRADALFAKNIKCSFTNLTNEEYHILNSKQKEKIYFSGTCAGILNKVLIFKNCSLTNNFNQTKN